MIYRLLITVVISSLFFLPLTCVAAKSPQKSSPQKTAAQKTKSPKNIVMIIADGFGLASLTGARIYKYGSRGRLNLESIPYTGVAKTYSSDNYVTDSAAAASALASGVKTYNGAIGVVLASKMAGYAPRHLETIADLATKAGKSTGVISTKSVTDATPAAYYAHAASRRLHGSIAKQVASSDLKIILGGGRQHFFPSTWQDPVTAEAGKSDSNSHVVNDLKAKGWKYVEKGSELRTINLAPQDRLIGLFQYGNMSYELDRQTKHLDEPSLVEMAELAIKHLSRDKDGFFLLIEGAQIDVTAHYNLTKKHFHEVLSLDETVKRVREMVGEDTLIVITSDHETGGLALNGYGDVKQVKGDTLLGASLYDRVAGLDEDGATFIGWASGPGKKSKTISNEMTHRANFPTAVAAHTAVDVMVMADGPGAENFVGFQDNTDIPKKIAKVMGWSFRGNQSLRQSH